MAGAACVCEGARGLSLSVSLDPSLSRSVSFSVSRHSKWGRGGGGDGWRVDDWGLLWRSVRVFGATDFARTVHL